MEIQASCVSESVFYYFFSVLHFGWYCEHPRAEINFALHLESTQKRLHRQEEEAAAAAALSFFDLARRAATC